MTSRWKDRYWSIDTPGLDSRGAAELVQRAAELHGVKGATVVNPDVWLTQHLDRDTVETLFRALLVAAEAVSVSSDEAWEIRQLAEEFRSWLEATAPSADR